MITPLSQKRPPGARTPYDRLGGELGLRSIIVDFVARVTSDTMIGFYFRSIDKERLVTLETQFAACHLGGPVAYEGRPLSKAHAPHSIMGGQFNRRLRILQQTLAAHGVDEDIQVTWLSHNEQLRSHITRDRRDECNAAPTDNSTAPRPKSDEDPKI